MQHGGDVNPDLAAERARASFNVRELTYILDGGRERTEKKERVAAIVAKEKVFDNSDFYFNTRVQNFVRALEKTKHLNTVVSRQHPELWAEDRRLFAFYAAFTAPYDVHNSMFVPTLTNQADDEQRAKWLPLALNYEIIGCYAQTELGHGSNVRGLETTATFDREKDEIVLHTPSVTAYKWWPGGLGKCATHAVLHARLLVDGQDHGVQTFFVQLRDENHRPLPGVTVGDIGDKLGRGFEVTDNGFLCLDRVRIPRRNMLMRYSKLARDGTFTKPLHEKVSYGTMLYVRAFLIWSCRDALARGCTIAVRYSCVRRQFAAQGAAPGAEELKVMDYLHQQHSLLTLLSTAYAFHFSAEAIQKLYWSMIKGLQAEDASALQETHVTCSGLKALCTELTANGLEECRRRCGGHGFSMLAGIPLIFADIAPSTTYEGDNKVLLLQVARFLLKQTRDAKSGKPLSGICVYLGDAQRASSVRSEADLLEPAAQLLLFRQRARSVTLTAAEMVMKLLSKGVSFDEAWNKSMVELLRAARAHCELALVIYFQQAITNVPAALRTVLKRLCDLFVLHTAENALDDLLELGALAPQQAPLVRGAVRSLLHALRPDAVALVDAFNYTDRQLNSALGRYDGRVYEAMVEAVKRSPLNASDVVQGYEEHLKPLLNRQVLRGKL